MLLLSLGAENQYLCISVFCILYLYICIPVEELKLTRKVDGVVVCFILVFSEINFKVLKRQDKDESPE